MATETLRAGESIEIGGVDVKVLKCGMHREGDEDPKPTVTLEYEDKGAKRKKTKTDTTTPVSE